MRNTMSMEQITDIHPPPQKKNCHNLFALILVQTIHVTLFRETQKMAANLLNTVHNLKQCLVQLNEHQFYSLCQNYDLAFVYDFSKEGQDF